jgi:hypothetical protein
MERNFTNENFENFLRQNADGLRMRPNEKVWKAISKKLNRRKRLAGFTIGSVLLAICTLGYFSIEPGTVLNSNKANDASSKQDAHSNNTENIYEPEINDSETPVIAMTSSPLAVIFEHPKNEIPTAEFQENKTFTVNPANEASSQEMVYQPTVTDDNLGFNTEEDLIVPAEENKIVSYPLTRESVFNLKPKGSRKKIALQFYFTPTVSYRRLSENKTFLRSPVANTQNNPAAWTDVNSMVTHKPDMGFEVGMAAKYPLTKNMKLRAGLQFSINRYDIKAYTANTTMATVMLNTRNNGIDSLNAITNYSNIGGVQPDWLENLYFQFSAPIGLEFKIAGNEKVNFGIATTIQPTYVTGGKSYMITTDYKSYTEVPDLVRKWNVHTSIETFVGYSTGRLNWQVGPQLRYQLVSSFDSKYPVKENLFNYGLKIGVSVNNHQ